MNAWLDEFKANVSDKLIQWVKVIKLKVYVASSWQNNRQPNVCASLRNNGHEVYDFRNPEEGDNGFHWSEIDPDWQKWTPEQYRNNLSDPIAKYGYRKDFKAMMWADACVLVMPCGRSAHLEAGYFIGANKILIILIDGGEPELMYKLADGICISIDEVCNCLNEGVDYDSVSG